MMRIKNLFVLLVWLGLVPTVVAQTSFEVTGTVRDTMGHPVEGVTVADISGASAVTAADGTFRLELAAGSHTLTLSHPEYESLQQKLQVTGNVSGLSFTMELLLRYPESIVVQAIRADATVPVTKTDVDQQQITDHNYGQEMPFLLTLAPSTTSYSDSGLGAGYSYFYLRGIQQTRINMTLDGVPLNDPEESAVYFANFGDFNDAVQSIQVQRGVGTSTVGASSFGGSVNFASMDPSEDRSIQGEIGTGSYASNRASLVLDSGRLGSGLALYSRLTYSDTDGFKEHSGVNQRTIYYGGTWQGSRSFFKFFGFTGREKTHLAYLATEESILKDNLRYNALSPEETDDFGQDLFQAQYTHLIGSNSSFAVQGYYNGAQGWFTIWDDPYAKTNLLKYAIDGYFVGGTVSYSATMGRLGLVAGAAGNHFTRDHFQTIEGVEQYRNNGTKNEGNVFAKLNYDAGSWHIYGDAQLRYAKFEYFGDLSPGAIDWTFFNPKVGVRYDITGQSSVYASAGRTSREPARSDLLLGEDNATVVHDFHAVKPESNNDFEAGYNYRSKNFEMVADVYAMEFRNEIALTGELSDIGLPLRRNVDRSFRRGVEVDLAYQASATVKLTGNANISHNRIKEWTQFYDVYDTDGNYVDSESLVHTDVNPLLTPTVILNQGVEWNLHPALKILVNGRYVSHSYLDNTNNDAFRTPSFFNLDTGVHLNLGHWIHAGNPTLRLQVTNILNNKKLWPSGYSYLYFVRAADGSEEFQGIPYYYVLATRSAFVALDFKL